MGILSPASGRPAMVITPDSTAALRFLSYFALRLIVAGTIVAERLSTVPAAFAVPVPGVYGVKNALQTGVPGEVGFVKTLVSVTLASKSLAPNVARLGSVAGRSGAGRQTWILNAANAVSGPLVGSTNAGTRSVWPAAVSTSSQ